MASKVILLFRYIYKITDFGAARELNEADQSFVSIYGTEEYLVYLNIYCFDGLMGRVSPSEPRGCRFNPGRSHTKDYNSVNRILGLAFSLS